MTQTQAGFLLFCSTLAAPLFNVLFTTAHIVLMYILFRSLEFVAMYLLILLRSSSRIEQIKKKPDRRRYCRMHPGGGGFCDRRSAAKDRGRLPEMRLAFKDLCEKG